MTNEAPTARWVLSRKEPFDYDHHECSACGKQALFYFTYEEDFDYNCDDELVSRGIVCTGIHECLTDYCPHCGVRLGNPPENE